MPRVPSTSDLGRAKLDDAVRNPAQIDPGPSRNLARANAAIGEAVASVGAAFGEVVGRIGAAQSKTAMADAKLGFVRDMDSLDQKMDMEVGPDGALYGTYGTESQKIGTKWAKASGNESDFNTWAAPQVYQRGRATAQKAQGLAVKNFQTSFQKDVDAVESDVLSGNLATFDTNREALNAKIEGQAGTVITRIQADEAAAELDARLTGSKLNLLRNGRRVTDAQGNVTYEGPDVEAYEFALDGINKWEREPIEPSKLGGPQSVVAPGPRVSGSFPIFDRETPTVSQRKDIFNKGGVVVNLDTNWAPEGKQTSPMVVIPDGATAEQRQAAEAYATEIANVYKERFGTSLKPRVVTRSENGRGRPATIHTEPYSVNDPRAVEYFSSPEGAKAHAEILRNTFGRVKGVHFSLPHDPTRRGDNGAVGKGGSEVDLARLVLAELNQGPAPEQGAPEQKVAGANIRDGVMRLGGPDALKAAQDYVAQNRKLIAEVAASEPDTPLVEIVGQDNLPPELQSVPPEVLQTITAGQALEIADNPEAVEAASAPELAALQSLPDETPISELPPEVQQAIAQRAPGFLVDMGPGENVDPAFLKEVDAGQVNPAFLKDLGPGSTVGDLKKMLGIKSAAASELKPSDEITPPAPTPATRPQKDLPWKAGRFKSGQTLTIKSKYGTITLRSDDFRKMDEKSLRRMHQDARITGAEAKRKVVVTGEASAKDIIESIKSKGAPPDNWQELEKSVMAAERFKPGTLAKYKFERSKEESIYTVFKDEGNESVETIQARIQALTEASTDGKLDDADRAALEKILPRYEKLIKAREADPGKAGQGTKLYKSAIASMPGGKPQNAEDRLKLIDANIRGQVELGIPEREVRPLSADQARIIAKAFKGLDERDDPMQHLRDVAIQVVSDYGQRYSGMILRQAIEQAKMDNAQEKVFKEALRAMTEGDMVNEDRFDRLRPGFEPPMPNLGPDLAPAPEPAPDSRSILQRIDGFYDGVRDTIYGSFAFGADAGADAARALGRASEPTYQAYKSYRQGNRNFPSPSQDDVKSLKGGKLSTSEFEKKYGPGKARSYLLEGK